jgi:hypothetical protein
MNKVEKFLKNPNQEDLEQIPHYYKFIIYGWCEYCIKNKCGKIDKATKLKQMLIPDLCKNICFDIRGVKSLFLAVKILNQMNLNKDAFITVSVDDQIGLNIYYNYYHPDLPDMFYVEQADIFGIGKELSLYYQDLREYLKNLFQDNLQKRITKITFTIKNNLKMFYEQELGIVWNENTDCINCTKQFIKDEPLDSNCEKMISEKCYDKFTNHPDFSIQEKRYLDEQVIRKTQVQPKITNTSQLVYKQAGDWTCPICLLDNKASAKTCIACGANKK